MAVKVTFFSSTLDKVNSQIGHIRAKLTAFSLMGLITFWPIDVSVVQKWSSCHPLGFFLPFCRSLENGAPSVSVKTVSPLTFLLQDLVNQVNPKNVYILLWGASLTFIRLFLHQIPASRSLWLTALEVFRIPYDTTFTAEMLRIQQDDCYKWSAMHSLNYGRSLYPTVPCHCVAKRWARDGSKFLNL